MKNYGKVRSTKKPQDMVIDDFSVWIHSDIKEVVDEKNKFKGYEYYMVQYTKDEFIMDFIRKQMKKNEEIDNTLKILLEK